MGRTIIGLAGLRGAGKDTGAAFLENHGYQNVKFAGALKFMIDAYLQYVGIHDPAARLEYIEGHRKEIDTPVFHGHSPRWAMQTLGTEWGRDKMGTEFWVSTFKARAKQLGLVVATDVRFHNEVDAIHDLGGVVYRVERGEPLQDRFSLHPSERDIPVLKVDAVIENNGTIEAYHAQLSKLTGLPLITQSGFDVA